MVYQEYLPWDWFYGWFINNAYPETGSIDGWSILPTLRLVLWMVYQYYLPWDWFYGLFINTTYPETGSIDCLSILPTLRLVVKMVYQYYLPLDWFWRWEWQKVCCAEINLPLVLSAPSQQSINLALQTWGSM